MHSNPRYVLLASDDDPNHKSASRKRSCRTTWGPSTTLRILVAVCSSVVIALIVIHQLPVILDTYLTLKYGPPAILGPPYEGKGREVEADVDAFAWSTGEEEMDLEQIQMELDRRYLALGVSVS